MCNFNEMCAVLHVYKILTILSSNGTPIIRLADLRYRHTIIVLYGLHVINKIFFSVSSFASFISMVNVK